MKRLLLGSAALCLATSVPAAITQFNATCPNGIEVHADQGGPVYINGQESKLKKFSDSYFEAAGGGVTISIMINPDESLGLSYTGKHGVNGICTETKAGATTSVSPTAKAEAACLAAVAKTTNVDQAKLKVIDVVTAEAGVGVTIEVPGADAPWSCLSSPEGKVQGASYTGSEGKL